MAEPSSDARRRVTNARVGRLATVRSDGRPHVVPCCFALEGDSLYTAVDDAKRKSTLALRRLDNIRVHPHVALLVDHYDDDWSALWWVRVDGVATLAEPTSAARVTGLALLAEKYEQYRQMPPPGPMIVIRAERWQAWP